MKCKVINGFIDKTNNKAYSIGDEFTCTEERYAEIQGKGKFLERVSETSSNAEAKATA